MIAGSAKESLAIRALRRLSRAVLAYPSLFLYPQIALLGLCVYFTITRLQFDTSRNNLVGSDKKYHQNFLKFKKEFPGQDDLVAIVESENHEKNRQFVERLGAKLALETNVFSDVFYKGDFKMLGRKALLFLEEGELSELQKTLKEYGPFIVQFTRATNLNSLFQMVNRQFLAEMFKAGNRQASAETDSLVKAVPALKRIVDQAKDCLSRPGTPPSPGLTALFDAGAEAEEKQYLTFASGQIYLVNARAKDEDKNEQAVIRMRALVRETQKEVPGLNVGITGEPVLELDEMAQSQTDSTLATIVSLVLCAFIFIYGYRETGRPLKATLCLIVGLGYTMGYTTLTVGHLNILTITFLPILIGLAIDFGVHLITRYEEELRHGRTKEAAIEKAMVFTGLGIITGCFTTAGAFLAMGLTDFKGIQEMGIITGGGMIICLIPMMTLLPVLLMRGHQNRLDKEHSAKLEDRRARIERWWLERPGLVASVTLVLCLLAISQFKKVYFDYNLLNMQSKGLAAVVYERKLIDSSSKSVLFAAVVADSAEEGVKLEHSITNLPSVVSVDSMSHYLAGDHTAKLRLIGEIKKDIQGIHFAEMDVDAVKVPELSLTLFGLQGYLGLAIDEVKKEKEQKDLADQLTSLRNSIVTFRHDMLSADQKMVPGKLAAFQQALFGDLQETFSALQTQDDSSGLRIEDLPPSLKSRFIGITGKQLLQVNPRRNVWQREPQEEFVKELRQVDINVTGTPVQLFEYTTLLKDSYVRAAWYSLGAIILLVFIHFRSLSCLILALLPVAIGGTWMGGLMGVFGVPFNPADIMTLPLVIGIGVTNGIHILNRFAEEQNPSILAKSTGKAVLVSGLATMAGFGSLIPAKHQGIASLGIVMSIGVATCMIAALTFLPALITLLIRRGWTIKKPSGDNASSTLGREEPR